MAKEKVIKEKKEKVIKEKKVKVPKPPKEVVVRKPREHKCAYCKEFIKDGEDFIKFDTGITVIIPKFAHVKCRNNILDKDKFYKLLYEVLGVPTIEDRKIFQRFDKAFKEGFSWKVMIRALQLKEVEVKKGSINVNITYACAIIRNSLADAHILVKEAGEDKPMRDVYLDPPGTVIVIPRREREVRKKKEIEF